MADLEADLTLDASQAQAEIDRLAQELQDALSQAADQGVQGLLDAISGIGPIELEIDTGAISEDVSAAIEEGAATPVEVSDVDASAISADVAGAIEDGADAPVVVENVDAQPVTLDVAAAIQEGADTTVVIDDVDASPLTEAVEEAAANADTSAISDGLGEISTEAKKAGADLGNLGSVATVASVGLRTGAGDTSAFTAALSKIGPGGAAAATGLGAAAFATEQFFSAALDARESAERLERVFGDLTDQINSTSIDGLGNDLSELALIIGDDDEALRDFAASFGQFGQSSGAAREDVAATTQEIIRLAVELGAANPALGEAGDIALKLSRGFVTGGKALQQFGIELDAATIQERAVADAGGDMSAATDRYALAAAGAALVTERLGEKLRKDAVDGAHSARNELDSLKQTFKETFEEAGAPLVDPLIDSLESVTPALVGITKLVGTGLGAALDLVLPVVNEFAEGVDIITDRLDRFVIHTPPAVGAAAEFIDTLDGLKPPTEEAVKAADDFIDSLTGFRLAGETAGEGFDRVIAGGEQFVDEQGRIVDGNGELVESTLAVGQAAGAASTGFSSFESILDSALDTTDQALQDFPALAFTYDDIEGSLDALNVQLREYKSALDDVLGISLSTNAASIAYQDAIDDLTESLTENGRTFDLHTEAGRENAAMFDRVVAAAQAEVEALTRDGIITGDAATQKSALIQRVRDLSEEFPYLTERVEQYATEIDNVPTEHLVEMKQSGFAQGREAAVAVRNAIFGIPATKNVAITTTGETAAIAAARRVRDAVLAAVRASFGFGGGGRAIGGVAGFDEGPVTVVGEYGPEPIRYPGGRRELAGVGGPSFRSLPPGTQVTPTGRGGDDGGSGVVVNVNTQATDAEAVARYAVMQMERNLR